MNYRDEFEKLLTEVKIGLYTPKEEFDHQILPLMQFVRNHIPSQLYKFRGCTENNIGAFEKDELWLSKAALFNDMHDSLFFFNKTAIMEAIEKGFSSGGILSVIEAIKQGAFADSEIGKLIAEAMPAVDSRQVNDMVLQSIPSFSAMLDQCFFYAKEGIRNR